MFVIMYEPMTRLNKYLVDGGITHAVNANRIEDIYFCGDMAHICLFSGKQLNVARRDALFLLDKLDKWRGGASKSVAEIEDSGRRYEKARSDVAKDASK